MNKVIREELLALSEKSYRRGCDDAARNISQEIYSIIEKHKEEDWRDLLAILETHLKGAK